MKPAAYLPQLPLSADKRELASDALQLLGTTVDRVIKDDVSEGISPLIFDYVKYVERAASDLAARRERERVLDQVLAPVVNVRSAA